VFLSIPEAYRGVSFMPFIFLPRSDDVSRVMRWMKNFLNVGFFNSYYTRSLLDISCTYPTMFSSFAVDQNPFPTFIFCVYSSVVPVTMGVGHSFIASQRA
jgi:hypothetical protein